MRAAAIFFILLMTPYLLTPSPLPKTNLEVITNYLVYDLYLSSTDYFKKDSKVALSSEVPELYTKIEEIYIREGNYKLGEEKPEYILEVNTPYVFYRSINNDNVKRVISIPFRLYKTDGNTIDKKDLKVNYMDTIDVQYLDIIENESYDFTVGEKPEKKSSFWDNFLEPAAYVTSAAVVIILLFTVRSD